MKDKRHFGSWLSGFTDGEGCFTLHVDNSYRRGILHAQFVLVLRKDDIKVLQTIKKFWKCGHIHYPSSQPKIASYVISSRADLIRVAISHFEKYPLIGKKKKDFEIWKQAVLLLGLPNKGQRFSKLQKQQFKTFAKQLKQNRKYK